LNWILVIFWIALAMAFAAMLYVVAGPDASCLFLSAYLVEKSLSVDNLFAFSVIFTTFAVSPDMQRRLLNWGIIGAIVFRGILILAGAALVSSFHWVLYIFGAILVWTAIKLMRGAGGSDGGGDSGSSGIMYFVNRLGLNRFLTCLLIVELSDVIFALDSIPATFAITQDPFIVFTANLFAILGLRSLYFVLVDMLDRFEHLKYGVSLVLLFIGSKMLLTSYLTISTGFSLVIVALILAASIVTSQLQPQRNV
jgi:tellurite resistance protein TerC